jgi:hypothetical protein
MKIKGEGPLLNLVPYTESNGVCGPLPENVEAERRRKISEFVITEERIQRGLETRRNNGKPWHSAEARKNISKALKGKGVTDETKAKISNTLMGRPHSEETKKKRAKSIKESYKNRKNANAKKVRVVLDNGTEKIFESQGDAGEFFGVTAQGIARVIRTGKTRLKIQSIEII